MKRGLFLAALIAAALTPGVASAAPVATFIAIALINAGASVAVSLAIAGFVTFTVLPNVAIALLLRATSGGKGGAASAAERQASVITLQLGEGSREAIFGEAATAGQLLDAFNWGGQYGTDWETLVVAVADHRCEALVGFYIGDAYHAFGGNGLQAGFNNQLEVTWYDGQFDQVADASLIANAGLDANADPRWTADDVLAGVAYVVVSYKADAPNATTPVWPQGRPSFLWRVKGARLYDPRLDDTVDGGAGAHRWDDPATWEWSDNAYLCRYAYTRGLYAGDQVDDQTMLLIGRGLSAEQAPPARVAAYANLCDEPVTLKAGGTEPRYRVNGLVRADESFIAVEQMFAAAMGGVIVQRDGGVEIEPGAAKAAVVTITDADLPVGQAIRVEQFVSDAERVNTVSPRYIEPDQLWRDHAAPVRRSTDDIVEDGGPRERTLSLPLVTSHTQAQRIGEQERRLARLERRVGMTLGPRFAYLEDGDWIAWQSDRYFGGSTVTFRVEAAALDEAYRSQLLLREIASTAYAWTAASDEGTPGAAPVDEPGSLDALELEDVAIVAYAIPGDDGSSIPAVRATWTTPVDLAIRAVRIEVRLVGEAEVAGDRCDNPDAGELVTTTGVPMASEIEARLLPIATDGRRVTASAWIEVTTGPFTLAALADLYADGDLTPGEKLTLVPLIQGLRDGWTALRVRANFANATVAAGHAARTAFELAAADLDTELAALTTPVAWDDASDSTVVADPAGLKAALQAAVSTTTDLQAELSVTLRPGRNALRYTLFPRDTRGWQLGSQNTGLTASLARNPASYSGQNNVLAATVTGTPAAGTYFSINAEPANYIPVGGGDRIEAHCLVAIHRLDEAIVNVSFYQADSNGLLSTIISEVPVGTGGLDNGAIDGLVENFERLGGFATAPSNARFARLHVRAYADGAGVSPFLLIAQPFIGLATEGQTALTPWHAGLEWEDGADITAAQQAASIAGQGALATQNAATWSTQVTGSGKPADNADVTATHTAAGIAGQGTLATQNAATWSTQVTGSGKPTDNADVTAANTAAAISGQGALAILNAANWSTQVTGSGKPVDNADVTAANTAAGISGQHAWATGAASGGVTPGNVISRVQYTDNSGVMRDYRGVVVNIVIDGAAARGTQPLTSTPTSITVTGHDVHVPQPGGSSYAVVSIPGTTISGLNNDTTYTVFWGGGSVWVATGPSATPVYKASSDGWWEVGAIRTQTSGGAYNPPTYGSGGVIPYCVAAAAFLDCGQRAGGACIGHPLTMMTADGAATYAGEIERLVLAEANCLRFTTAAGAVLTVSETAPIMTRREAGQMPYAVPAADCRPGAPVPILVAGQVVWDTVSAIQPVGRQAVARISAGQGIFAASDTADGVRMFTHNGYNKP